MQIIFIIELKLLQKLNKGIGKSGLVLCAKNFSLHLCIHHICVFHPIIDFFNGKFTLYWRWE